VPFDVNHTKRTMTTHPAVGHNLNPHQYAVAGVRDNEDTAASGAHRGWLTLLRGKTMMRASTVGSQPASSWAGRPTQRVFSYGITHSSLPLPEAARYSEVTIISYVSLGMPADGAKSCPVHR